MTVFILGSEGFIGRHLVAFYLKHGWKVHGADLLEVGSQDYSYHKISRLSPEFDALMRLHSVDVCINAAGTGNVSYSLSHPVTDFEANCLDTVLFLEAMRRERPDCKYVHISSAAVYGNPAQLPVTEPDSLRPLSPYGWHKLISEQICMEYFTAFSMRVAIVRPFSVFGPGLKKQLFWELGQRLVRLQIGQTLELSGTGKESRDFIYIDSLIEALSIVVEKSAFNSEVFNLGTGIETTIERAAEVFVKAFAPETKIVFNGQQRPGDPKNWRADISRISNLGFKSSVTLEDGLRQYASWLKTLG